jgi:hypothetical protein
MRAPETISAGGWVRPESGMFQNAWAVGNRRFVLEFTALCEGFHLDLKELRPSRGLVPTPPHFGAGC